MEVTGDETLLRSLTEIRTEKISFANTALTDDTIKRVVQLALPNGVTVTNPSVVVEIDIRKKSAENSAENANEKKEAN